jgi:hypothetical protein
MSTIKMFLALFLIGSGVYVGAKIIPPFFENYQFQDAVKSEATLDTYTSKNENDIRTAVFRKAKTSRSRSQKNRFMCSARECKAVGSSSFVRRM